WQSTEMADAIQRMAADASRLQGIAEQLASGAHEGVERNAALAVLAAENRTRFDASAVALEHLASDARASADAVKALAEASEEFGAFVTLVRGVLGKVQESRALSARTMDTVIGVLETTQLGMHSFAQVEEAVRGSEA